MPKIAPTIVLSPDKPIRDLLRAFLRSNQQFQPLPEETLVLPTHNVPSRCLHVWLDEYEADHATWLDMTYDACWLQGVPLMSHRDFSNPPSDPHQLFFAVGEALSHTLFLETDGKISAMVGEDGATISRQTA